jgi:hypothetical protein
MTAPLPETMMTGMSSTQFTTQAVYAAAIAVAMVTAGLRKRRIEWKWRRPKRRKRGWR